MISNLTGSSMSLYTPLTNDRETLYGQYKILAGRWAENYDELVINLGNEGIISDLLAYELGLKDTKELDSLVAKLMSGESSDAEATNPLLLNYEDLLNLDLRAIVPSDLYKYNDKYCVYDDMSTDKDRVSPPTGIGYPCREGEGIPADEESNNKNNKDILKDIY